MNSRLQNTAGLDSIRFGYGIFTAGVAADIDLGAEYQGDATASTATSTEADFLNDTAAAFVPEDIGRYIHNTTDDTLAKIVAVKSSTRVEIDADIMADTEDYVMKGRFHFQIMTLPGASDAVRDLPPYQITEITPAVKGTSNTLISVRATQLAEGAPNTIGADTGVVLLFSWLAIGDVL